MPARKRRMWASRPSKWMSSSSPKLSRVTGGSTAVMSKGAPAESGQERLGAQLAKWRRYVRGLPPIRYPPAWTLAMGKESGAWRSPSHASRWVLLKGPAHHWLVFKAVEDGALVEAVRYDSENHLPY